MYERSKGSEIQIQDATEMKIFAYRIALILLFPIAPFVIVAVELWDSRKVIAEVIVEFYTKWWIAFKKGSKL